VGVWGWAQTPNPPTPNPQSPIPNYINIILKRINK